MTKFGAGPRYKDPVSGTEWANEHTFHIAYWMLNDLQIYQEMKNFMQNSNDPIPYRTWIKQMGLVDKSTTSGWKLMADGVHYGDLSEIMRASMYQFWATEFRRIGTWSEGFQDGSGGLEACELGSCYF